MKCDDCPVRGVQVETEINNPDGRVDIFAVMENPGEYELLDGTPAIGRVGQILRATMEQLGVENVAYGNAFQCDPPSVPGLLELCKSACTKRLIRDIKEADPKLVYAMGGRAIDALLGVSTVKQISGQMRYSPVLNKPVLAGFNPAYYLYSIGSNREVSFDEFFDTANLAARYVRGEVDPLNYSIDAEDWEDLNTLEDIDRMIELFKDKEVVSVDLETSGFDPFLDRILMGVIATPDKAFVFRSSRIMNSEFRAKLWAYLESREFITYNGMFDISWLRVNGCNIKLGRDIMIERHLIDETNTAIRLKDRGLLDLGVPEWESPVKHYVKKKTDSYEKVPSEILAKYCAVDGLYTSRLANLTGPEIKDRQEWAYHNIILPITECFIRIRVAGIPVNPYGILEGRKQLKAKIDQYDKWLQELADRPFNCNTPQEHSRNMFGKFKLRPVDGSSTDGKVLTAILDRRATTDQIMACQDKYDTIKELYKAPDQELIDMLWDKYPKYLYVIFLMRRRENFQTMNTYLGQLGSAVRKDCRIHPEIFSTSTKTGRASATKPSVMNIKDDPLLKEIFSPFDRKGNPWYFLYADQSQNELRTYSGLSQDQTLIKFYQDQHANALAGRPEMDIHTYTQELTGAANRLIAKTYVFGPLYGRTDKSIARELGLSDEEGERIGNLVRQLFPRGPEFAAERLEEALDTGQVVTPLGRVRHFPYIDDQTVRLIRNQVANYPTQSVANDFNYLSVIEMFKRIDQGELNLEVFFPVHDSILSGSPPSEIDTNKEAMVEIMSSAAKNALPEIYSDIPFKVEPKYGWSWQEADPADPDRRKV